MGRGEWLCCCCICCIAALYLLLLLHLLLLLLHLILLLLLELLLLLKLLLLLPLLLLLLCFRGSADAHVRQHLLKPRHAFPTSSSAPSAAQPKSKVGAFSVCHLLV